MTTIINIKYNYNISVDMLYNTTYNIYNIYNSSNIIYNKELFLDNSSYIKFTKLPDVYLNYSFYNYNKMTELIKSPDKSKVLVYNKNITNPKYNEIITNRWFKSYLNTPKIPNYINKSYMFSGYEKKEVEEKLPNIFNPIYQFFKRIDNRYNQVVINYYEREHDSIALHSDWDDNMINNYEISILTVNKNNNKNRYFSIVSKNNNQNNNFIKVELYNGLIITMGGNFQKNYRHGIQKISESNALNQRLGITFRQFI